jgi:hypothetical protein
MNKEVLRFYPGTDETLTDYTIIVRSDDYGRAWRRFKSRIDTADEPLGKSMSYCSYATSEDGTLTLLNPDSTQLTTLEAGKEWKNQPPVFFETTEYKITIKLHDVDPSSVRVKHVQRSVEDVFVYDTEHDARYGSLTGTLSFLNEPGRFNLEFEYSKYGITHTESLIFDVVSPKLDTKDDYKKILDDVNREYDKSVFRYLTLTYQNMRYHGSSSSDEVWLQVFENIITGYIKAVDRIVHKPHFKTVDYTEYKRADKIKRWTVANAQRYYELRHGDPARLERHYFECKKQTITVNTLENRFVKYTLVKIGKRLGVILNKIIHNTDLSESRRKSLKDYQLKLLSLQKNSFFKAIGRFEGLRQESMVLQSKSGYAQVYKDYLILKRGIDFYDGSATIGTMQIWEVYELWCLVKLKHLIADVMGLDTVDSDQVVYAKGNNINQTLNDPTKEYRIRFNCQDEAHQGDYVELCYQRTYNRFDKGGMRTATTEQRPDFVVDIHKHDDIVLTYMFDAKYRVLDDNRCENDDESIDYPVVDAINQMHRYRDAIYYGNNEHRYAAKEVIGGYILFPGRGGDTEEIKKKYFYDNIKEVNIGAFPLLPNEKDPDAEGRLLKEHLHKIIMEENKYVQLDRAKPQWGLYYKHGEEHDNDIVLIGCVKNKKHLEWIESNAKYNIRLLTPSERQGAVVPNPQLMNVKYIVLYTLADNKLDAIVKTYAVGGFLVPTFYTADEMKDYPFTPGKDHSKNRYLVYELDENENFKFDTSKLSVIIEEELIKQGEELGKPFVRTVAAAKVFQQNISAPWS